MKSNKELFKLYKAELALRIHNDKNLVRYYQVLDQFSSTLGDFPPSAPLAKQFLSKWAKSRPATLHKYSGIIKGFMSWYGEEVDLKVKLAHQLPEYVEDTDVTKMIKVAGGDKRTHKGTRQRDVLMIVLAYTAGLRRSELANLLVGDVLVNERAIVIRRGKGQKDRTVPLTNETFKALFSYTKDMNPLDRVFNLAPTSISDKIHRVAAKAGVNIHAHSLRHGYATRLLEKGANIKAVQELLGHARIGTTEGYLSLLPKHLRNTVDLLETTERKDRTREKRTGPRIIRTYSELGLDFPTEEGYIDEEGYYHELI